MYEKVYKGVSRLQTNYFLLLCSTRALGTYHVMVEDEVPGKGQTFTVALSGKETYRAMQRVFEDANG